MAKGGVLLLIASVVLLLSLAMLLIQNKEVTKTTGFLTSGTTISNVTISKYLSITMSGNLTAGIIFGTVNALPATNVNASGNNNTLGNSSFFLNVSTDSNTNVDFCVKANSNFYDPVGGNTISVANESYSNSSVTDSSLPDVAKEVVFTTSYVKAGENVTVGNVTYYRFYLDVPVGTPSGNYNNTVNFEGVQNAQSC